MIYYTILYYILTAEHQVNLIREARPGLQCAAGSSKKVTYGVGILGFRKKESSLPRQAILMEESELYDTFSEQDRREPLGFRTGFADERCIVPWMSLHLGSCFEFSST